MDFSKLTDYLDSLGAGYGVPGLDCKIMQEHRVIYRHMAGYSDYAKTKAVSSSDVYDFYSASKLVTMTAAMRLVEAGMICLDDPVSKYLPAFEKMRLDPEFKVGEFPSIWPTNKTKTIPAKNPILIKDLMMMTAGLSYDIFSEPIQRVKSESNGEAGTIEVVNAIAEMPLIAEPGTRFSYGLGHDVIGAVIEVVSGKKFSEYMKENIFDPLEVFDLAYQVTEEMRSRLSAQYALDMETGDIRPNPEMSFRLTERFESGGAGLVGSVDSYSLIIDALANNGVGHTGARILKKESVQLMSRNWLSAAQLADFEKRGKIGYGYGLGVRTLIDPTKSKSPLGEFGWDGAAGAYALVDPIHRLSIFYVQEILEMPKVYSEIHPTIRDLVYEAVL